MDGGDQVLAAARRFPAAILTNEDVRSVGHLLAGCAVGPDFLHPAAPASAGYTKEPLAPRTSSADAPQGQPQRFAVGLDISAEWWTLFRSPALNALVQQSLNNNPSLQTAMANLRAARQAVYAQEGKFFPTVTANFNPTNQLTPAR
jgi:outer membrane protein TolC